MIRHSMNLMHPCLRDFLLLNTFIPNQKISFISLEVSLPSWFENLTSRMPYIIGLNLRREFRHIIMGIQALKQSSDIVFVFEVYLQHIFFNFIGLIREESLALSPLESATS